MKFSSDDVKAKVKDLVKNELLSHRTEGEPWEDYVEDAVPRLEKLIAEKKLISADTIDSEDLYNFLFDTWIDSGCP